MMTAKNKDSKLNAKEYWGATETARFLGLSRTYIYRLAIKLRWERLQPGTNLWRKGDIIKFQKKKEEKGSK